MVTILQDANICGTPFSSNAVMLALLSVANVNRRHSFYVKLWVYWSCQIYSWELYTPHVEWHVLPWTEGKHFHRWNLQSWATRSINTAVMTYLCPEPNPDTTEVCAEVRSKQTWCLKTTCWSRQIYWYKLRLIFLSCFCNTDAWKTWLECIKGRWSVKMVSEIKAEDKSVFPTWTHCYELKNTYLVFEWRICLGSKLSFDSYFSCILQALIRIPNEN